MFIAMSARKGEVLMAEVGERVQEPSLHAFLQRKAVQDFIATALRDGQTVQIEVV